MAETKQKNIFQRMLAITADLRTVAKNLSVDTGGGKSYKAVSERDILDAVKPLEEKHGVYSYPYSRKTLDAQTLQSESKYGVKTTFYTRLETVYRFVNVDKPEEFIETVTYSVGIDSQDKGDGKAMTYGDKYALMKAYKISTGDDPDQTASEDTYYQTPGTPVLASAEEKQTIMNLCKAMNIDFNNILTKTGWSKGEMLTREQAVKALDILHNISDERSKTNA